MTSSGCRIDSASRVDSLEAQLRSSEQTVDELERQLADSQRLLKAHRHVVPVGHENVSVRESSVLPKFIGPVEANGPSLRVEIGTLLSGGLDRDDQPGDELLSMLVVPSMSGSVHPVAGCRLMFEVFDFSKGDESQMIGKWEFDEIDTADLWHAGVIGTGYRVVVPWQTVPQSEQLTVHARLTTPNGVGVDISRELKITPPSK